MKILYYSKNNREKIYKYLQRPALDLSKYRGQVLQTIKDVRKNGDKALRLYTERFDGVKLKSFRVSQKSLLKAYQKTSPLLLKSLRIAADNIKKFYKPNEPQNRTAETVPGVYCRRITKPLASVGLYIPAGSAPLVSTVLMLGVPAKIAGVSRIAVCSPPQKDGKVNSAILATCKLLGIEEVYAMGGAQAIAALAYGTASIPKVDKIVGPGNAYVTAAKAEVSIDPQGAAIDMLSGPSELLVIADSTADPRFVSADLVAQAEHDPLAKVILVSNSLKIIVSTRSELARQLKSLPRKNIAGQALQNCLFVVVPQLSAAVEIANAYAPEHLSIQIKNPTKLFSGITNAGSVFLGSFAPEAIGDYCSGTNHALPTMGTARFAGGVSVQTFQKTFTAQSLTKKGLKALAETAGVLARAEGLEGHARSVEIRLASDN